MEVAPHSQLRKLRHLIRAADEGQHAASRGHLFCSRSGVALINAAFDLFECDALYDLAGDVARDAGFDTGQWER
jgi:hypothetical protein